MNILKKLRFLILILLCGLMIVGCGDTASKNNDDNKQSDVEPKEDDPKEKDPEEKDPEEEVKEFNVIFNTNGGTGTVYDDVFYLDEAYLVPTFTVTKHGYKFIGWEYNGNIYNSDDEIDFTVEEDVTLTAQFARICTITLKNNNGDDVVIDNVFKNYNVKLPKNTFNKDNYVFIGWSNTDGGEVVYTDEYEFTYELDNDLVLHPVFEKTYVIVFNNNGGIGLLDNIEGIRYNDQVKLPKNTFTKEGYEFLGWSLNAGGELKYSDEDTITFNQTSHLNLYAVWKKSLSPEDVMDMIDEFDVVTIALFNDIKDARVKYDCLTASDKQLVTNIDLLEEAEAEVVTLFIEVLTYENYTATDITNARAALESGLVELEEIENLDVLYIAEWEELYKSKYSSANNDYQGVLTEVGYAYLYQGNQIQYDQNNYRRNMNATPEMATTDKGIYLDCSGYTNAVMYYTFGQNVLTENGLPTPSTQAFDSYIRTSKNSDVIYNVSTSDYTTDTQRQAILTEVKNNLQVGDLLVYRHGVSSGTSGHVMMYIGNSVFLHCTGTSTKMTVGSFDPDTFIDKQTASEATDGAVQKLNASTLFSSTGSRYLFKDTSSDKVFTFGVIRMLNRDNLTLTEEAINRYVLGGAVAIEKKASVNQYKSVRLGYTITYSIVIKNNGTTKKNKLYVVDELPEEVEFLSVGNDGTYLTGSNKLVWQIPAISAGETITLSYQVKVKNITDNIGKTIENNNSVVCGIELNTYKNQIEHNSDLTKVVEEATKLIGIQYSNNLDFVKAVYKNAWDVDILDSAQESKNVILANLSYWRIKPTSVYYPYQVVDCFGGIKYNDYQVNTSRDVTVETMTDNSYLKLLRREYLQAGDIIIAHSSYGGDHYNCYLYQSETSILSANSGTVTAVASTATDVKALLTTMEAYDRFIVIRPSLVY